MSARLSAILLAGCTLAPTLAASAPFGLHAGDRPPAFSIVRDNGDGTVVIANPPASYPGLVQYFARYDDANGLCSVAGATAPFIGDSEGIAARTYFKELQSRLSALYGAPSLYTFDLTGDRSSDTGWTAGIASGSRFHYAFWHDEGEARSIALGVGARDSATPFVILTYDFANFDRCTQARAMADAPSL